MPGSCVRLSFVVARPYQGCFQSPLFTTALGIRKVSLQEAKSWKQDLVTMQVTLFKLLGLVRMTDQARAGPSSPVITGENVDDHKTQSDADP